MGAKNNYWTDIPGTHERIYYDLWANIGFGYVGRSAGITSGTLHLVDHLPNNRVTGRSDRSDGLEIKIGEDLQARFRPDQLTTENLNDVVMSALTDPAFRDDRKLIPQRQDGSMRQRPRTFVTVLATVSAVLVAGGLALLLPNEIASRREVPLSVLTVEPANIGLPAGERAWSLADPPAESASGERKVWWSDQGEVLSEEVDRHSNIYSAHYSYLSDDPSIRYRRDHPEDVRGVKSPRYPVSRINISCANTGLSQAPNFTRCSQWTAIIQVGQYTLILESIDITMSKQDFLQVVSRFVDNAHRALD